MVGIKTKGQWFTEKPYGMTLIPGGSFTMGKQDEDIIGTMDAPARTVTVKSYYMDETEITNSEYKQFVFWVRDSIVRTKLALQSEFVSAGDSLPSGGIHDFAFKVIDTTGANAYDKYMFENYYEVGYDSVRP